MDNTTFWLLLNWKVDVANNRVKYEGLRRGYKTNQGLYIQFQWISSKCSNFYFSLFILFVELNYTDGESNNSCWSNQPLEIDIEDRTKRYWWIRSWIRRWCMRWNTLVNKSISKLCSSSYNNKGWDRNLGRRNEECLVWWCRPCKLCSPSTSVLYLTNFLLHKMYQKHTVKWEANEINAPFFEFIFIWIYLVSF